MEYSVLLLSHGKFCEAVLESTEMIYGKLSDVYSFPLLPGMSPEEYLKEVDKKIQALDGKVILLADLYGGTPSNISSVLIKKYGCLGFTGLNIPLLLSVMECRANKETPKDMVNICSDAYQNSFHDLKNHVNKKEEIQNGNEVN